MNFTRTFLVLVGMAALSARAAVFSYNFTNGNTIIPDGDMAGISDTHTVNVGYGFITQVTVSLNISGGYNGDLYGYLVSDSGYAVLLNGIGRTDSNPYGSPGSGMNVTFNDVTGSDIHNAPGSFGTPLTGTWGSDGRTTDPTSVSSSDPRTATLSSFIGGSANGNWTLFLADTSPIGQSTLNGWSLTLNITSVPEPTTWAMAGFGLMFAGTGAFRWWKKRSTNNKEAQP